jgi:hypothetical protein
MTKINTGLRLDPEVVAAVNEYLERLKREPGRSSATFQDAVRALVDIGLAASKKSKRS